VDIDTNHFLANHPPYAALDATELGSDSVASSASWSEILLPSALRPGSQNLFVVSNAGVATHVRLRIFPDGGVARLRVYGDPAPDWSSPSLDEVERKHARSGEIDLAALKHGGRVLACSDMFFGPMDNLIARGRPSNMGGGWETRRRREPGHDWILLRLAAPGRVSLVEVSTEHFKGNYPDRCSLDGIFAPGAPITELVPALYTESAVRFRQVIPELRLGPDSRHFLRDEISDSGPFTHVRLNVIPDGGVSRLRVFGLREIG
jgi:allantoicase